MARKRKVSQPTVGPGPINNEIKINQIRRARRSERIKDARGHDPETSSRNTRNHGYSDRLADGFRTMRMAGDD